MSKEDIKIAMTPCTQKVIQAVASGTQRLVFALALSLSLLLSQAPAVQAQSSVTMRLQPASATQKYATAFSLAVYVNSGGESVNAVEVDLSYPTNLLEFVSFDSTGTDFEIEAPGMSGSGGTVTLTRASATPQSGASLLVTKLNFKTKSTSGSASLQFGGNAKVIRVSDTQNVLASTSGATITIQAPTTTTPNPSTENPPSEQPSGSPGTDKPTTGGTTTPGTGSNPDEPDTDDDPDTPTQNGGSTGSNTDNTDSDSKDVEQSATEENRENRDTKDGNITMLIGSVAAGIALLAVLGLGLRAVASRYAQTHAGHKKVAQVGIMHGKSDAGAVQQAPAATVIYPTATTQTPPVAGAEQPDQSVHRQ